MNRVAKSIQMIACFDESGKINPVRFKYEQEEEGSKIICINKVINRSFEKLGGNPMWKFTCSSVVDDSEYIYNVKYDLLNGKWLLFDKK